MRRAPQLVGSPLSHDTIDSLAERITTKLKPPVAIKDDVRQETTLILLKALSRGSRVIDRAVLTKASSAIERLYREHHQTKDFLKIDATHDDDKPLVGRKF